MRTHLIAAAILALCSAAATPAMAQVPPTAPASPVAGPTGTVAAPAAAGFSVETSELGTMLDAPAAKVVLVKHIPELVSNDQIDMARPMTLRQLQQYAGDALSDEVLAKIQVDLDKLFQR